MIKKQFYMGFCGFIGFFCLRYFSSGDVMDLILIGFFGFFSNFIIARIKGDKADERYAENQKSALAFTGRFAIMELFILWCVVALVRNGAIASVLLAIAYAITPNVYATKLYQLEEK